MKNALLALTIALFSAGCAEGVEVPDHNGVLFFCEMEDDCAEWDMDRLSANLDRFSAQYKRVFGVAPVLPTEIHAQDTFWNGLNPTDSEGNHYIGHANGSAAHVVGVDLGGTEAVLPMEDTSFWHELTHAALDNQFGDVDGDHVHGLGPWTADHDKVIRILATGADFPVLAGG